MFFKKYPLLLMFVLAVGVRLIFLAYSWNTVPTLSGGDEEAYHLLGVNLLRYHTYGNPFTTSYQPEHAISPGYPLFVATVYMMVGVKPHGVLIVQCILDSLIALLTCAIVLRLNGSQRTAMIAGMLYALWPAAWYYAQHLYPEPTLTLIFAVIFWLIIKPVRWRPVSLGALCALALYIKSTCMLLPVIAGIVLFMQNLSSGPCSRGKKWGIALRQTAVFVAIVIGLLAPWLIRNKLALGRVTFATLTEINFFTGSGTYTLAELQGEYLPSVMSPRYAYFFDKLVKQAENENPRWKYRENPSNYYTLEQMDPLAKTAQNIIVAHPVAFLKCYIKGALRAWLPERNSTWFRMYMGYMMGTVAINQMSRLILGGKLFAVPITFLVAFFSFVLYYGLLITSAVLGAWRLFPRSPMIVLAVVMMLLYMTILPSIYSASDRYILPVMPLLFVLAAFAPEFPEFFKRKNGKTVTMHLPTQEGA
ncbi:MAG: hypothetical protein NT096_01450 [Proteobacteria bacterium]|nr:hypothetical protein [Pseudomonadota bacterium]